MTFSLLHLLWLWEDSYYIMARMEVEQAAKTAGILFLTTAPFLLQLTIVDFCE